uniref:Arrestin C-terminal-like domain-containing protein n=1 Tax=Oryzias melastigma TaxID=30732 RepID=A0A3B3BJ48_ORYME
MAVKHFSVEYDKLNERGAHSPGDVLSGKVTVVTSRKVKVQRFHVKAKGKAKVAWHEEDGQTSNKKKYFEFEHIFIQDKNKGDGSEIMPPGKNIYPFSFVIPNMPSSFKGKWGEITYSLRAQLTQSIWLVQKTKTEFPFVTNSEFPFGSKSEQYGSRVMFLGSGKVTMNVSSEKVGLEQGEAVGVFLQVLNDSACSITPKFYLCEKQTFVAQSKRKVHTKEILFGTGDLVPTVSSYATTKVLSIPPQLYPTFFNCCMMKLEYRIKVSLDIRSATNPEIKLPLVILRGFPKPPTQKPKRSIWFKKFPASKSAT